MMRWVKPPDADDVYLAYVMAASLMGVDRDEFLEPHLSQRRALQAAVVLSGWGPSKFEHTTDYLAAVALEVSRGRVLELRDSAKAAKLCSLAGIFAASKVADGLLRELDMSDVWSIVDAVVWDDHEVVKAELGRHLSPLLPAIRVVFLTPLTDVDSDQQQRLVEVAVAASEGLGGLVTDIPGTRLAPDLLPSWAPSKMRAVERQRVLSASVAVVVNGEFASWGAAQCTSWLESIGVPVLVYGSGGSRVLTPASSAGTVHLPYCSSDPTEPTAADIVKRVNGLLPGLRDRAQFNHQLQEQWIRRGLFSADPLPVPDLPFARVKQIFSSPLEFSTMSSFEASSVAVSNSELLGLAREAFDDASLSHAERWQMAVGELESFEYVMSLFHASRTERQLVLEKYRVSSSRGEFAGADEAERRKWGEDAWTAALREVRGEP